MGAMEVSQEYRTLFSSGTKDGGRRTEDSGVGERIDSSKELRVYKEAWALNLEVLVLGTICANL